MEKTPSPPSQREKGKISPPAWRSLEELAGGEGVTELLGREFAVPPDETDTAAGLRRRDFLKLVGGTLGLAGLSGLSGCTVRPRGKIVPYVDQPEQIIPGKPLFYATALEFRGYGRGVLVETHEGRPTKVEGNPTHPATLGATSIFEQAALFDLYNPARSNSILKEGELSSWNACLGELQIALEKLPEDGAGLCLLTETITSPTFADQWKTLSERYPAARWYRYEPLHDEQAQGVAREVFGAERELVYHFDKAKTIVSFDSDFLFGLPGSVRYARDLMAGRESATPGGMSRIYALEAVPTITGCYADERKPVRYNDIIQYVIALAEEIGTAPSLEGLAPGADARNWARRVAADLKRGEPALFVAGESQPGDVHRLVHELNRRLGSYQNGVIDVIDTVRGTPKSGSLGELAEAANAGSVTILLMLGGNWVRTAPADTRFEEALAHIPLTIHSGLYVEETALASRWHIPQAHPFEVWGDTRAFDGTASIIQPLIEPLFGGRSVTEIFDCVVNFPGRPSQKIIKSYWMLRGMDEDEWRRALHDGVVAGSKSQPTGGSVTQASMAGSREGSPAGELDLLFVPDGSLWDGRYGRNSWLQELPRPITKLSWENAFLISPATAAEHEVTTGSIIEVREVRATDGRALTGMVLVQPGVAAGTIAVSLGSGSWPVKEEGGYFQTRVFRPKGREVECLGINAYPLRTSHSQWRVPVSLVKQGGERKPLTTQHHHLVHGRDLLRVGSLQQLEKLYSAPEEKSPPTLYNLTEQMTDGYAWAMSIDLSRCIACNACMVACQAENNIPPVGWEEVSRGREMHWIRLDSYYFGDENEPFIASQPMACMHCETAPCELVCPVEATLHDHEGLNVQVYNRCIGTRYCSNNCPYKVRRFNFFRYAEENAREPLQLMANPDVTIRARGVMEKCTYCVQRISAARIRASIENRPIRDGEVIPACAQVCPTETIIFGNINDPASRVAARKRERFDYVLLREQGTHPRTSYLPRVINPEEART